MSQDFSTRAIDSYARLAATPPDTDLLRRYLEKSATGTSSESSSLTAVERRWVETNLRHNPSWLEAWRRLESETGGAIPLDSLRESSQLKNRPPIRPSLRKRIPAVFGGVILLYGVLWLGGWAMRSETHDLASIETYEIHLDGQTRSAATDSQTRFADAARALLEARKTTFGLFPRYDRDSAEEAISHLREAFALSRDPFERAEIAFFMAKAYLMRGQTQAAQEWLLQVQEQRVTDYRADAADLLLELGKLDG